MWKRFITALLLTGVCCLNATESRISPHLDEVVKLLDASRPGLKETLKAADPAARQQALREYFRNRPVVKEEAPPEPSSDRYARLKKTADLALEHSFTGQPAYGTVPRGEVIDWDSTPVPDKEWLWQFHRFTWFSALRAVYLTTGDERYAKEWAQEIDAWCAHMLPDGKPRRHAGWRTLEIGIRMKNWAESFNAFAKSPSVDGYTVVEFLYALSKHAERISGLYKDGVEPDHVGNWDIFQLEGLLIAAALFPEYAQSNYYAQKAVTLMSQFQRRVILPDGVIDEFIPSYHTTYPRTFSWVRNFCRQHQIPVEFPADYDRYIENAVNAMVIWSHPDGTSPVFGDSWLGKEDGNRAWVKPYLAMFDRPDWRYFVTAGAEGENPGGKLHELPDAGYYTMRSGWSREAVFLVAKNTNMPKWRGHNQQDNLTFELSAYGRKFMVDSGCYNYSGEPGWRAWFRKPFAHQMVSLDDLPVTSVGRKILSKSVDGLDLLVLENAGNAGFTQRRTFFFLDNRYFLILDEITGEATGRLRQHFQFAPGPWVLDADRLTARTMFADGPNLVVRAMAQNGLTLFEEEGWFSGPYMTKEPRPAFAYAMNKSDGNKRHFLTLVAPLKKVEQIWSAELGFLKNGRPTTELTNELFLRLNNEETFLVRFDANSGEASLTKAAGLDNNKIERELQDRGKWQRPPIVGK